jgi:hypothetical protein
MKRCLIPVLCLCWAGAAHAQDAINLSAAVVHNSPADVASWPVTTRITQLTMLPENTHAPGLSVDFSARASWPDYTPPGFQGPIQYTFWAGVRIAGVWHVSGFHRMWRDRAATGAPILTNNNFAINWAYDSRWGPMAGYVPVAGEAMIFFVTAGNARGVPTVTSVRERSNVVIVNLPANDTGVFRFAARRTDLLIDFGAEGLWTLNDAADFARINAATPKNVIAYDLDSNSIDEVIADFGAGIGIWIRWNGTTWSQFTMLTTDTMAAGDLDGNGLPEVILGIAGGGTYVLWNGTNWGKLNDRSPSRMLVTDIDGGGRDLVLDFPGSGISIFRNGHTWLYLHAQNSTAMTAGDFDGNGSGDLAIAFPGAGVWLLMNAAYWAQVNNQDAVSLTAGDVDGNHLSDLVIDFGPGLGIWLLRNSAAWSQLNALSAEQIVLGDLDGNGLEDIILDFGPGRGVWVLGNLSSWVHAHPTSPEQIVAASLN